MMCTSCGEIWVIGEKVTCTCITPRERRFVELQQREIVDFFERWIRD